MASKSKFLILPLTFMLLAACSGKKVSSEKVLEAVVGSMCKKIVTCQPNAMPNEDFCKTTMQKALESSKGGTPKVEADQKQLDACIDSINKSDCQNLLGSEPPKGCEFLK